MELVRELLEVVAALENAKVDYAICGGLAVAIHGFPRHTKDIDLLIEESSLEAAKRAVASVGFDLDSGVISFQAGTPSEQRVYRLNKTQGTDFLTLDFILVSPILTDVWNHRRKMESSGNVIKVVSREGLIAMKRLAGRPIDHADVAELESPSESN